ncbi:MAG: hypothetical protein IPM15_20540 [Betaproteobacteria bacterium]|nr:hypothetical protein [Betaproteobacteria bacterium]
MPYFIYALRSFTPPECLGEHAAFADASARAKALRVERQAAQPTAMPGGEQIRVVFAATAEAAEDLLLTPRTAPPIGDE